MSQGNVPRPNLVLPLLQLPNGNWIDPTRVSRVYCYQDNDKDSAHIMIWISLRDSNFYEEILTPDFPSAERLRDQIAREVNAMWRGQVATRSESDRATDHEEIEALRAFVRAYRAAKLLGERGSSDADPGPDQQ